MSTVRVKICGIRSPTDAEMAARLGADAVGINFYEGSPRCVQPGDVKSILNALPPFVEPVAVLVSPSQAQIRACIFDFGFRTLQLHAADPREILAAPAASSARIILASGVDGRESLQSCDRLVQTWQNAGIPPAAILIDAKVAGLHGGTGRSAPWPLLADYRSSVPIILAGGLTAENVSKAIRIVRPFAVDVASGVERSPGVKDEEKVQKVIAAVAATVVVSSE